MADDVRSVYEFDTEEKARAFVQEYERQEWARSGFAVAMPPEIKGGPWSVKTSRRHSCD